MISHITTAPHMHPSVMLAILTLTILFWIADRMIQIRKNHLSHRRDALQEYEHILKGKN